MKFRRETVVTSERNTMRWKSKKETDIGHVGVGFFKDNASILLPNGKPPGESRL